MNTSSVDSESKAGGVLSPQKKSSLLAMLLFGGVSGVLYFLLLANGNIFVEWAQRTQQGEKWLFVVPVAVAFLFSYVHGSFTSHFWETMGLRAASSKKSNK